MPQIFHHIKSQITYIPLSVYCSLKGKLCNVVHVVKYVLLVIHFLMIQVQRYLLKIENMECIWDLIKKQYLKFTNWLGFKDFRYKWFWTAWLASLYGKRLLLVCCDNGYLHKLYHMLLQLLHSQTSSPRTHPSRHSTCQQPSPW